MNIKVYLACLFALFCLGINAAKIDTVMVYSVSMQKEIPNIVVTPDSYNRNKSYPVVYMLHGHGGSYKSWASEKFITVPYADMYNMIFVIPDGGVSSWYFDSPVDPEWCYETYITKELLSFVDKNYATITSPGGRAITGLSMGGHGAFYLAFRHQDIFGAAGSMSGGVDIRPFPDSWSISKRLGSYAEYPDNWEKNTIINMTHLLAPHSLALIFDCGTEDFFYEVNCSLHEKLMYLNIPHEFTSRPGGHTAEYWKNSIKHHLLFFHNFFEK